MQIVTRCGSRGAPRAGGGLALASIAAVALGSLAFPYTASAAPVLAKAGQSTCDKVSTGQVSSVVGYNLPNPTPTVDKNQTVDKKHGITGSTTECTYTPKGSSTKTYLQTVELSYLSCNKSISVSEAEADIKASLSSEESGGKWVVNQDNLSHPGLYFADSFKQSGTSFTIEAVIEIDGAKMAGAVIAHKVPESTVNKLADLAASAWL